MKVDGITLLEMARDNKLKSRTILKTEYEKQYFDDRDYDYYIYFGDNQFHRCNEKGILGSKFQNRFLNYETLKKEFEHIEPKEEKEIEEIDMCTSGIMGFDGVENITSALKDKINELVREVNKIKKGAKNNEL